MLPRSAALGRALLVCGLSFGLLSQGAAAESSSGPRPDRPIAVLLATIEQQIAAGHTTTPTDDNAVRTWAKILRRASPPSAAAARALSQFAAQARDHARREKKVGRDAIALDLVVFADLADNVVKEAQAGPGLPADTAIPESHPAAQTAVPATSVAPVPAKAQVNQPARPAEETTTADRAARDKLPAATTAGKTPKLQPDHATPTLRPDNAMAALYFQRGNAMLAQKDVSAARKYFAFGADAGSARSAAALAGTYDPAVLARLGVVGLRPDPNRAAAWYARAKALGDAHAGRRLQALQVNRP